MRILFDQGVPVPLRRLLVQHEVRTAFELGWATLKNGALLGEAERAGFELLLTTDSNLKYQQNLAVRSIGILVLSTTSWPRIRPCRDQLLAAIEACSGRGYVEVEIP